MTTAVVPRKTKDQDVTLVESVLRPQFPTAECYRYNSLALRARVIDERFRGLSQVARSELVEPLLDQLPKEIQEDLFFVLLLAPEDVATSAKNSEFESPKPSLIA